MVSAETQRHIAAHKPEFANALTLEVKLFYRIFKSIDFKPLVIATEICFATSSGL